MTNVVLFPDEVDDVIGVVAQYSRTGTFDVLAQLLIDADLLRRHREDYVDCVFFHLIKK